jgi:hypothetical protein
MDRLNTLQERNSYKNWLSAATLIDSRIGISQVNMRGQQVDNFLNLLKPVPVAVVDIDNLNNFVDNSPSVSDNEMTEILSLVPSLPANERLPRHQSHFYVRSLQSTVGEMRHFLIGTVF